MKKVLFLLAFLLALQGGGLQPALSMDLTLDKCPINCYCIMYSFNGEIKNRLKIQEGAAEQESGEYRGQKLCLSENAVANDGCEIMFWLLHIKNSNDNPTKCACPCDLGTTNDATQ